MFAPVTHSLERAHWLKHLLRAGAFNCMAVSDLGRRRHACDISSRGAGAMLMSSVPGVLTACSGTSNLEVLVVCSMTSALGLPAAFMERE